MRVEQDSSQSTNGRHTSDHRSSEDNSAPIATEDYEQGERKISDELTGLLAQFQELREYFSYFLTAKADSVKLSFRHFVLGVALAAIGFVALGGLIVIASWLLLSGTADGLGRLFGDRPWIGSLVTGFLLLVVLVLGIYGAVARQSRIARERTAKKYERRQTRQKAQFGRNVADWTATSATQKK